MQAYEAAATGAPEPIVVGPLTIRFLVTGKDSGGSAALFELGVPAGAGLPGPAHSHDTYEETLYGLGGVLTVTVDGRPIALRPGEAVCIPRGAVHRFANHGDAPALALAVVSSAGIGPAYFQEVAAALAEAGDAPPNPARMGAIMRRHGLTPAPPR
jgi:quercetin dioxygenase-like cupin family protein